MPAGAVNDMASVFEQSQAQELVVYDADVIDRSSIADGPSPAPVGLRQVAFKRDQEQRVNISKPPKYAEHTRTVLADVLGLSCCEIDELIANGAVTE